MRRSINIDILYYKDFLDVHGLVRRFFDLGIVSEAHSNQCKAEVMICVKSYWACMYEMEEFMY